MYVCSEWGMPAGTCHHAAGEDYVLLPAERYEFENRMINRFLAVFFIVAAAAVVAWFAVVK